MTRPGPKPQPTELKLLNGNPGKRRIPDSPMGTKPAAVPSVPAGLGTVGTDAWALYWTHGRAWLALTDAPHVARLCRLMDMAAICEATIAAEGMLIVSSKTRRSAPHFLVNQLLGLYKTISELEASCGFTPADRTRMRVQTDESDALDKWQTGRTG